MDRTGPIWKFDGPTWKLDGLRMDVRVLIGQRGTFIVWQAEVIKDEFKASVRQVLQNALRGIETDNFELPLYSRGGQRVELLLNATTRHSAKGEVVGVVMVGQDITEKKDIEKAQIAAAKARAASDAKGKFMASMSHEMRTPLNGVLGMLQVAHALCQ
jgi:signal transduction histidine kinase